MKYVLSALRELGLAAVVIFGTYYVLEHVPTDRSFRSLAGYALVVFLGSCLIWGIVRLFLRNKDSLIGS